MLRRRARATLTNINQWPLLLLLLLLLPLLVVRCVNVGALRTVIVEGDIMLGGFFPVSRLAAFY